MVRNFLPELRSTSLERLFREYLESSRQFWRTARQRGMKLQEAHGSIKSAFRLQEFLIDRQALRFGHLVSVGAIERRGLRSLNSITERLDQGWSDADESALLESNSVYRAVSQEIKDIQSTLDTAVLTEPLRQLQRDRKYLQARQVMSERVRELDARLQRLI
jgi:hypothetical protein